MMNEIDTSALIQAAIAKWQAVVDGQHRGPVIKCSLCDVYLRGASCRGCPVMERTGKALCVGTPFYRYVRALKSGQSAAVASAARAQLAFARSLLRPKPS